MTSYIPSGSPFFNPPEVERGQEELENQLLQDVNVDTEEWIVVRDLNPDGEDGWLRAHKGDWVLRLIAAL